MSKNLVLYYREFCPYSRKVLSFIEEKGIKLSLKDIGKDEEDFNTLVKIGGKQQVPCLFIDGKPLYESNDIIGWLEANA